MNKSGQARFGLFLNQLVSAALCVTIALPATVQAQPLPVRLPAAATAEPIDYTRPENMVPGNGIPVLMHDGEEAARPSEIGPRLVEASASNTMHESTPPPSLNPLATAKKAAVDLVPQQILFTLVMGALTQVQFAKALAEDPLALQRTWADPFGAIGMTGFYVLMATQGYSDALLTRMVNGAGNVVGASQLGARAGAGFMLPAVTLGIGMGASMYVSNLLGHPATRLCARLMVAPLDGPKNESLTPEQRRLDLAERRARLFRESDMDPTSNPCDMAYDELISKKKLYEMAPMLASVMTSSILIAFGQRVVLKKMIERAAVTAAGKAFSQMASFTVRIVPSALLGATSMVVSLKMVAFTALHLAAFVTSDHVLQPYFVTAFNALKGGYDLQSVGGRIDTGIREIRNDWLLSASDKDISSSDLDPACKKEYERLTGLASQLVSRPGELEKSLATHCYKLNADLRDLGDKLKSWRQEKILMKVMSAYWAWDGFLKNFQALHDGSQQFYESFVLLNQEYAKSARGESSQLPKYDFLAQPFETFGIRRLDGAGKQNKDFTKDPEAYIKEQLAHVRQVAKVYRTKWPDAKLTVNREQRLELSGIVAGLETGDRAKVTASLKTLLAEMDRANTTVQGKETFSKYSQYYEVLRWIRDELGDPQNLWEPGRGALYLVTELEDFRPTYQRMNKAISSWARENIFFGFFDIKWLATFQERTTSAWWRRLVPGSNQRYAVDHIADKLLVQMACGPEAGPQSNVISYSSGWGAEFNPPALTPYTAHMKKTFCEGWGREDISKLYTEEITTPDGKKYKGIIDFLRHNIRPELRTTAGLRQWWEKNIDLIPTYKRFRVSYDSIVANLWQSLFQPQELAWYNPQRFVGYFNAANAADNTVVKALEQDVKYQLAILGDIYAAALRLKNPNQDIRAIPGLYAKEARELAKPEGNGSGPITLAALKGSDNMVLDAYLNGSADARATKNFTFQEDVLAQFRNILNKLAEIRVETEGRKEHQKLLIRSKYSFTAMQALLENLESTIKTQISVRMGLEKANAGGSLMALLSRQTPNAGLEKIELKNPVIAETAKIARDNLLQAMSELQLYTTTLTLASLKLGDAVPREAAPTAPKGPMNLPAAVTPEQLREPLPLLDLQGAQLDWTLTQNSK